MVIEHGNQAFLLDLSFLALLDCFALSCVIHDIVYWVELPTTQSIRGQPSWPIARDITEWFLNIGSFRMLVVIRQGGEPALYAMQTWL